MSECNRMTQSVMLMRFYSKSLQLIHLKKILLKKRMQTMSKLLRGISAVRR